MKIENDNIITDENYYQDREYISASMVKQALQGSKKQFDYAMNNSLETEAMLVGSAFHSMILEPEKFESEYAFEPAMDRRTKAGKEYIEEWKKQNENIPNHIPGKHEQRLLDMKDSLMMHNTFKSMLDPDGEFEQIKLFELCGVKCKAKIDYYNPKDNYILDIKTCNSVQIDDIVESIRKYSYGIQAAFYLDGLKAHKFYFAFIDKNSPHDVVIVDFIAGLQEGRKAYEAGISNIQAFAKMEEEGVGPGYSMFNKIIRM